MRERHSTQSLDVADDFRIAEIDRRHRHRLVEDRRVEEVELVDGDKAARKRGQANEDLEPGGHSATVARRYSWWQRQAAARAGRWIRGDLGSWIRGYVLL